MRRSENGGSGVISKNIESIIVFQPSTLGRKQPSSALTVIVPGILPPNGAAGKRCPGGASVLTRWFAGAKRRQRVPLTRRPVRRSRSDRRTLALRRGWKPQRRRSVGCKPSPAALCWAVVTNFYSLALLPVFWHKLSQLLR